MIRSTLLYLSRQSWLRHWVESSSLTKAVTARFVAGQTLDQTLTVCETLEREGTLVSLDYLGENVTSLAEAQESVRTYRAALSAIGQRGLPATVSIKLSQFGLDLSAPACTQNVRELVQQAKSLGTRVEIDMESSEYVDRTLAVVEEMHREFGCVRAVIQAYLRRSEEDIRRLNAQHIPVRLCKGAYQEPPVVAFPKKSDVDVNYVRLIKLLLSEGTYPAVASHDERIVTDVLNFVRERGISPDDFEFQMLYGIRRDLQSQLHRDGFRLRLYIPFGEAWYPYFMRRLAERPANVLFLARNLVRR